VHRPIVVALVGCAALARAEPNQRSTDLFDQGRDLAKKGEWAAACSKFAESFALDHATGTELNLGDCHEHLGHAQIAWHFFDTAAAEFARASDKRAEFARGRADALLPKLATIIVKIAEPQAPGLAIAIGGHAVARGADTSSITDHFDPGNITVEATMPGKQPFVRTTTAIAGATVLVEIPTFSTAVAKAAPTERRRSRVHLALGLGIAGGAIEIGAVAIAVVAKSQFNRELQNGDCVRTSSGMVACNPTGLPKIQSANTLGDIGTGVGVAAAACGVTALLVYLTAPRDVVIAPTATGRDIGITLTSRF
jgi:hypothetical protein